MSKITAIKSPKRKLWLTRDVIKALAARVQLGADAATAATAVSVNCTIEGHSLCIAGCTTTVRA